MTATAMNQTEFADHLGVKKSYVTELKKAGRLVFDAEGRIDVEASVSKIEATRSPDKTGVAARHARERIERGERVSGGGDGGNGEEEGGEAGGEAAGTPDYQRARARREEANANIAEMEARERAGFLIETAGVVSVLADAATTLRVQLEPLGSILAPQLALMNDEHQIRLLIEDHVEQLLGDLSSRFGGLIKEVAEVRK